MKINPHSCLFLLAARQSVQAPSALAPQRRLPRRFQLLVMTYLIKLTPPPDGHLP